MASSYVKRFSTSLHHQGNVNVNTVTYHLTVVRMAISKTGETASVGMGVLRREHTNILHCWWKCSWYNYSRNCVEFLKKLKIELVYGPSMPPMGMYPEEINYYLNISTLRVYCRITQKSQGMGMT